MNNKIELKLNNLPDKPGSYMMLDTAGEVIYVGKAKVLKNRVRQYFHSSANHPIKVRKMVEHIDDIDYIVTDTEAEALLLECNLIKKYRPYYNILLKDDKSYPYLKLTTNEEYPKLVLTRKRVLDKSKYYGPYSNAFNAKKTLEAINRVYKLKMCNKNVHFGVKIGRECLNYHIGLCEGVCQGEVIKENYNESVMQIDAILSGKTEDFIATLTTMMYDEAEKLNFEVASQIKEQIKCVKNLNGEQKIDSAGFDNRDIIATASDERITCVQMFMIRDGKVVSTDTRYMKHNYNEGEDELLSSFIEQYYVSSPYIPNEILVQYELENTELISEMLSTLRKSKVQIKVPQKGEKRRLLDLAIKNAILNIESRKTIEQKKVDAYESSIRELERLIGIEKAISRIESYDISNIAGTNNVGVMVVFEDGKKSPKLYRRFKIKEVDGQDDYASMAEVIFRRLSRADSEMKSNDMNAKFLPLPEVILVDGGKTHVKVVRSMVENFGFDIKVAGLVKNSKHKLRGLAFYDGSEVPISEIKYAKVLLNDISEEVHRYAIDYHRKLRSKSMLSTELESIEGVGEKRVKILLSHFSGIEQLSSSSLEELKQIDGISCKVAKAIYDHYNEIEN